jgi:hypothetical protein
LALLLLKVKRSNFLKNKRNQNNYLLRTLTNRKKNRMITQSKIKLVKNNLVMKIVIVILLIAVTSAIQLENLIVAELLKGVIIIMLLQFIKSLSRNNKTQ